MSEHTNNPAFLDALLSVLCRFDLAKLDIAADCPAYLVSKPWQKETLKQEPGMAIVRTAQELEDALANETISALFVPKYAFGLTLLERVLARYSTLKTIYLEA